MDLIHKIESLRYDIENGVETDVIKISVRLIQIKEQALQLQQTGVSGSFDKLIDKFKLETDLVWYKNPNIFKEWANDR